MKVMSNSVALFGTTVMAGGTETVVALAGVKGGTEGSGGNKTGPVGGGAVTLC